MTRSDFTYGQLDRALRSLGFSRSLIEDEPQAFRYDHTSGAIVLLPPFPQTDKVLNYHLVAVRGTLDNFGIADPTVFAAELQKAS